LGVIENSQGDVLGILQGVLITLRRWATKLKNGLSLLLAFSIMIGALLPVRSAARSVQAGGRAASASNETSRQANNAFDEAQLLTETAPVDRVRRRFAEAVRLWKRANEAGKAASAALRMGDLYARARSYAESLAYYKEALTVGLLSIDERATTFNSMAHCYRELNALDLALRYYNSALRLGPKDREPRSMITTLSGLARIHLQRGDLGEARTFLEKARGLATRQLGEEVEANLLLLDAGLRRREGALPQASASLARVLEIGRRNGNIDFQVRSLSAISELELSGGEKRSALNHAGAAVKLSEELARGAVSVGEKRRTRELRWLAWLSQARAERAMGKLTEAEVSYQRARQHIDAIWWATYAITEASASGFGEYRQAPYRELASLMIEKGNISQALEYVDAARAKTIKGMITARRKAGGPPASGHDDASAETSRAVARLRTQLLSTRISARERGAIEEELLDALFAREEARIRAEAISWVEPLKIEALKKSLARGGDSIVEFLIADSQSWVFLVSPKGIYVETLPGRKEIESRVLDYLALMNSPPNNLHLESEIKKLLDRGKSLFRLLFGGLSAKLTPGQNLTIVPDGILHYLPFETLVNGAGFLIKEHRIGYLESTWMVNLWSEVRAANDADRMELLAFADPLVAQTHKLARNPKSYPSTKGDRTYDAFELSSLPRSKQEVKAIAGLFPPEKRRVYIGENATEDALKSEFLSRFNRIHLATHSLIDESSPWRSFVLLALDNNPRQDGFLEVGEVSDLVLDCDLVVLSSCQTGRGQLLAGEGIVGLSRAFLVAGARSVVVSLWDASEGSTSSLMEAFYQRLVHGAGNASALREAKLQMIDSGNETTHPYYWAPFVLVGKP
jgi:tetratricopeptide (TPR) repeat protein